MKKLLTVCAVGAFAFSASAIQTAGTLLVDLRAADVASVGTGNKVQSWQNKGSQAGFFTNVVANQGPEFCTFGPANTPAVYFSGEPASGSRNNNSILAGMPADARITGANSWTMEAWICTPAFVDNSTFFSWTFRGASSDGLGGPQDRLFEARYSNDGNAIEHYSGNVGWGAKPARGLWHHVVLTRDAATQMEYVYVNGAQVNAANRAALNIMPDGIFTIGGTQNGNRNGWDMQSTAYIGQIRVHSGFMPLRDGIINYMAECGAYGSESTVSLWEGAVGMTLLWETASNWLADALPSPLSRVLINNGGSASLTTPVGAVQTLAVTDGELNMSGSAALDLWVGAPGTRLYVANAANANATLNLTEGFLRLRDNNSNVHLSLGSSAGAVGTMTIGGGVLPARAEIGRDVLISDGSGSTGRLTMLTNGTLVDWGSSGHIYVGTGGGTDGKLTVNGGTIVHSLISLGNAGGRGVLEINDGYVRLSDRLQFAPGNESVNGQAILRLNGGVLHAQRLNVDRTAGENAVYFNGGTLRNTQNHGDFIQNIPLYVQEGGAVFDIIGNMNDATMVTDVTVPRVLQHDPALDTTPDGGITKKGPGILRLSNANTFTGDVNVEDGMLIFTRTDGLPAGYPGTVRVSGPGAVGCNQPGGIAMLLQKIANDSDGYLVVFPENANESINLSGHPDLKIAFYGNVTYQGTITPCSGTPLCLNPLHQATLTYTAAITGGTALVVDGKGSGTLVLGSSNSYAGGTTVKGGKIRIDNLSQLGSGDITLEGDGALQLTSDSIDPTTLLGRITTSSRGYLLLIGATAGLNFDLSAHPGIYIGTAENGMTQTGTITPSGDDYHVGGGWTRFRLQGNSGLSLANLTDNGATPRGVAIEGNGIVRIPNAGNTFTGPIAVTNKGALYINNNAQNLGGSSSLTVSDGTIRTADGMTIPDSVTLTVGDGGMEANLWGNTYTTFDGALEGSGRIWTSDTGGLFFGDVSNFTGHLDPCHTSSGSTLGVIVDEGFTWNPAITVSNSSLTASGYFGVHSDIDHAWSTTFVRPLGSDSPYLLGLKKRGTGALTVDVEQLYTGGDTLVEQGTLLVGHDKALPAGIGRGRVGVSAGATLDVNGRDISVNALTGVGLVRNGSGAAKELTVGADDSTSTLTPEISPELTLVKVGAGTLTLSPVAAKDVQVRAGTVALRMASGINGNFSLTGTSMLQAYGATIIDMSEVEQGLTAYYFRMPNGSLLTDSMVASAEALISFFNTATPTALLVTNTIHAGETFDFDRTTPTANNRFPAPFDVESINDFAAIYRGTFIAEETGAYIFGLESDDRSALFINGNKIVERNGWPGSETASLTLEEGEHEIMIGYYEGGGSQGLRAWLKRPSDGAIALMPQSVLRPEKTMPACRLGGVNGTSATRLIINNDIGVNIGPAELGATATFSGTVTAPDLSVLRKTGAGRQIFATAALNLGYIDTQEGTLELAVLNGTAPAFVQNYLANSAIGTFTGVTMASLMGDGGDVALADGTMLMMNKATTEDTVFSGSLEGSDLTAVVKADGQVLTLTGNNDAFLGTWIIHSGTVEVAAGGTIGLGAVINNDELRFAGDEDFYVDILAGNGRIVKQGTGTLYVSGKNISQTFLIEEGSVIFDTDGGTIYLDKIPDTSSGGTWGMTGGGKVVMTGSGEPETSHIIIDGETVWYIPTGVVPVQEDLEIVLDASKPSSLAVDAGGLVTNWTSLASKTMVYMNDNLGECPRYEPDALGGLGAVLFGTNVVQQANVPTRLSTTTPTVMQTVFMVSRFTKTQGEFWPNVFGQTGTDAGIRAQENSTSWKFPGSADDFVNGTGGQFYLNGTLRTDTSPNVGTAINLMTQYAGSSKGGWTTPINTSVGWYHESRRFSMIEIGELLVYSRKLDEEERLTIEAYLSGKWLSGQPPSYDLPEGLTVELRNGGVMSLENSSQTVSTVIVGEGGGSVLNGTLTVTDTLVINVDAEGATDPLAFDNVAFGPNAKLIVNGLGNAKGAVDVFTANSATPVPPFAKASLPKGWVASYHNGVCRLSRNASLIILK